MGELVLGRVVGRDGKDFEVCDIYNDEENLPIPTLELRGKHVYVGMEEPRLVYSCDGSKWTSQGYLMSKSYLEMMKEIDFDCENAIVNKSTNEENVVYAILLTNRMNYNIKSLPRDVSATAIIDGMSLDCYNSVVLDNNDPSSKDMIMTGTFKGEEFYNKYNLREMDFMVFFAETPDDEGNDFGIQIALNFIDDQFDVNIISQIIKAMSLNVKLYY